MTITITESAINKFKTMSIHSGPHPRIEIVSGGCKGFEKKFRMDNQHEDDICIDLSNGDYILIDRISYEILNNSKIDYKTTLTGSYFSIDIPNVNTCGCGSSFDL